MYTVVEPSPTHTGSRNIMTASPSSTLFSANNSGPGLISTSSPNSISFYDRSLRSPLQSVSSMHHNSSHLSNEPNPPPIPLSPPLQLANPNKQSLSTDVIIKSSPSPIPTPGITTMESNPREDDTVNFTSSSCLYNLDTVQTSIDSSTVVRTDHILRHPNMYPQNSSGAETQANQTTMDINTTSDIPTSLLMTSDYGNHYNLNSGGTRASSIDDSLSHISSNQYSSRYSNTNPLDLQDHQKRINNNNTLVSGYPNPNSTAAAFTPSPSSDSHCESPTTPKMHSLTTGGGKDSALLCSLNGNDKHLVGRTAGDERDILSPIGMNASMIPPPYHMAGSPTTGSYMGGGSMVDIGIGKSHHSSIHTKTPQGKNGLDNGSSTSLTPPNSATHLRKDCSGSYGSSHLNQIPTMDNDTDEIMLEVSTASAGINDSFTHYGSETQESNLGMTKRMNYTSPSMAGTTTGSSTMYPKSSASTATPPLTTGSSRTTGGGMTRGGNFVFSDEQIDCISDSLQQRRDYRMLENFLSEYSSHELSGSSSSNSTNGRTSNGNSESVVRGMAAVAYENGNYRDLYQIIESRDFNPVHHEELQQLWYDAHYKEAEGVRGRPLGKFF